VNQLPVRMQCKIAVQLPQLMHMEIDSGLLGVPLPLRMPASDSFA